MRISDWSSDVCSSDIAAADMAPHGPRARLDADERVILDILQRIDGVIADHPGDRPGIEQGQRQTLPAVDRDPADERAPTEPQAEPPLRPPGDALQARLGRDEREAGERPEERRVGEKWVRT